MDYWDTRDALVACKAANNISFKGGRLEARFALNSGKYVNLWIVHAFIASFFFIIVMFL